MHKLNAWLLTLVGVLWTVSMFGWAPGVSPVSGWMGWIVALAFLVMGVCKIMMCNEKKRRK